MQSSFFPFNRASSSKLLWCSAKSATCLLSRPIYIKVTKYSIEAISRDCRYSLRGSGASAFANAFSSETVLSNEILVVLGESNSALSTILTIFCMMLRMLIFILFHVSYQLYEIWAFISIARRISESIAFR